MNAPSRRSWNAALRPAGPARAALAFAFVLAFASLAGDAPAQSSPDARLADAWYRSTFPNAAASLRYHCRKHAGGRSCARYTRDALDFCRAQIGRARPVQLRDGTPGILIRTRGPGGYFKPECAQIVTFWYD